MTAFCSLYLPGVDNLAETIRTALTALGYERYDPFGTPLGAVPGKAYPLAVRLFVAPARGGWTRVLVALDSTMPDPALLLSLSRVAPCLLVALDDAEAQIEVYTDGAPATPETALAAYLQSPNCADYEPSAASAPSLGGIALDALPGDVQTLARRVDLKQAESMFARLSGNLAAKSGGDSSVLPRQPDWNSAGGRRIAAWMNCLGIPDWRSPDFVTLRDAYALHERRRQRPNATLYPGDADALAAVPDALAYTPVYAGKP
jgi:hypothetical protein